MGAKEEHGPFPGYPEALRSGNRISVTSDSLAGLSHVLTGIGGGHEDGRDTRCPWGRIRYGRASSQERPGGMDSRRCVKASGTPWSHPS